MSSAFVVPELLRCFLLALLLFQSCFATDVFAVCLLLAICCSGVNILGFGILFLFSWCLFPGLPLVNLGDEAVEVLIFLGARG